MNIETHAPDVSPIEVEEPSQAQLPFSISPPEGPIGVTPHDLMDERVFEEGDFEVEGEAGGTGMGSDVHEFAEEYARSGSGTPTNDHERNIVEFIDDLPGEKRVEEPVRLPMEVDGRRVTMSGIVDLVHVTERTVECIDYKTDASRRAEEEYRKQLSAYYHVLESVYPERDVTVSLYYSAAGRRVPVTPLPLDDLAALVESVLTE
ncbi:MAG: PD-(D/E)XK nuclease family protein [Halobacteriaceae archaeon]